MNEDLTSDIISRLERSFTRRLEKHDHSDYIECLRYQALHDMKGYEVWFVPEIDKYDEVMDHLGSNDVVFDVGAGDLRFDLIMTKTVLKVYAVEVNPTILYPALKIIGYDMPDNLITICGNAFDWHYLPHDVTAVTCLMVHRKHEFPIPWRQKKIIYADLDGVKVKNEVNNE